MSGSVGGIGIFNPWDNSAGDAERYRQVEQLKENYMTALCNQSDNHGSNFHINSSSLSVEVCQALCINLDHIFTDLCSNQHRTRIIESLLIKVPQEQWSVLMKQVCFIMPKGTQGHDVMWATEILAAIADPSEREQVVNTAHGLFTYNASTCERGYILEAVKNLPPDEIKRLYGADKEERTKFVNGCLPSVDFREGFKVVGIMDPCQKKWVKLEEDDNGAVRIIK